MDNNIENNLKYSMLNAATSNKEMLRIFGMWPLDWTENKKEFFTETKWWCTTIFAAINIMQLAYYVFGCATNFNDAVESGCVLIASGLTICIILNLRHKSQAVIRILNSLNDSIDISTTSNLKIYKRSYKFSLFCCKFYPASFLGTSIFYSFLPFFVMYKDTKSNPGMNTERQLPYHTWFPYNEQQTPAYQITYAYLSICSQMISICISNHDAIIFAVLIYIYGGFELLCENLENIRERAKQKLINLNITENNDDDFKEKLNKELNKLLAECVVLHCKLLNFCEEINKIISPVNFFHFVTQGPCTCVILWQFKAILDGHIDIIKMPLYGIFLTSCILEIFVLCWFGSQIMYQSTKVAKAAYFSEWYEGDTKFINSMCQIIQRAQRPVLITAGKSFSVTLQTFIVIMKSVTSYFAVLQSMQDS